MIKFRYRKVNMICIFVWVDIRYKIKDNDIVIYRFKEVTYKGGFKGGYG